MKNFILFILIITCNANRCKIRTENNIITNRPQQKKSIVANKLIIFSNYKKYNQKTPNTDINIIRSFFSNSKCDSIDGRYYANVFLCSTWIRGKADDTILVFSICPDSIPLFLSPNYDGPKGYQIDTTSTLRIPPKNVFVNIDTTILNKGYKYIIAKIQNWIDD